VRLEPPAGAAAAAPPGGAAAAAPPDSVRARVQSAVRGEMRTVSVPVRFHVAGGEVQAEGEFPLRQTELGLTPFSAFLGALQVQDEMQVSLRLVAHAAQVNAGDAAPPPAR